MTNLGKNGSVEFRFFRPGASDVRVTGTFNGWSKALAMHPGGNGWWVLKMDLEPGEYQFRYVADGVWYTDFASNGIEVTKFGWNSVLVVPGMPAAPRFGTKPSREAATAGTITPMTQGDNQLLVA